MPRSDRGWPACSLTTPGACTLDSGEDQLWNLGGNEVVVGRHGDHNSDQQVVLHSSENREVAVREKVGVGERALRGVVILHGSVHVPFVDLHLEPASVLLFRAVSTFNVERTILMVSSRCHCSASSHSLM